MPRSDRESKWAKFGNIKKFVFLSDDVIAVASGIHVMFLNLTSREERIEEFNNAERGIGASCLAGHPVVPMFATAERRSHPKIFVFTYPAIRKVSSCVLENEPNGYLSSVFSGTEYLLALTTFPNFRIVVWLWRTGEHMTEIDTTILDPEQRIACSSSSPYLVSQLGETSGKLVVYEMNVCSKIVTIAPINGSSSTANIVCSSWTNDGNLFHCDATGNVSLMSSDGRRCLLLVREENSTLNFKGSPLIETLGTGVIFANRQSEIVLYRKPSTDRPVKSGIGDYWRSVWSVQATSHPVAVAKFPHKDSVLFCGERGELFEISCEDDSPKLRIIFYQGSKYEFLTAINPRSDHVVAIDGHDRLSIFQCLTGQLVGVTCLKSHGRVQCVTSHPSLPIIATGTVVGKCVIVNAVRLAEPSVIRIIHLQRESVDRIRYSFSASQLGVADTRRAKLFVIDATSDEGYPVLGLLHSPMTIIDFLIYENNDGMASSKILILLRTIESVNCGRKIVVYSFNDSRDNNGVPECVIQLTNVYDSLNYGRSRDEIVVVPYLTKQLHLIQIPEDYRGLMLTDAFSSGHQLRNINVNFNTSFIVTCSYDGLTIVRSRKNIQQVLLILMSHHRSDGGAKFAILSATNNTVVSLGRNGDIIATSVCNIEPVINTAAADEQTLSTDEAVLRMKEDYLTWVERRALVNLQNERAQCAVERSSIHQDFLQLRERLKLLINANNRESANAQLRISEFELDKASRDKKIYDNIKNREELTEKLEEKIIRQNRVEKYLREMCWDSMEIPACSLISFNGKIKVENFPVPRISKDQQDRHKWERFIVEFKPFEKTETKRNNLLPRRLLLIGTTTNRWIPENRVLFGHQIHKFSGYPEYIRDSILIREQERKLKVHFNKLFEEMRVVKERELDLAAHRIEEIKHCSSELKNTFGIDQPIDDSAASQPLWHYSEKPETIVTTTDSEISSRHAATFLKRDISLEMIRKQKEESLKLNDSFREEALQIMMDGLLEVRWEDEIKKDPPQPLCLTKKEPSNYVAEEIAEVQLYQMKCRELREKRDKYKELLNDKIVTVKEALSQSIDAFDRRLNIFYLDRMKIETAIFQETLMRLRKSQGHLLRRREMETMRMAEYDLALAAKENRYLNGISSMLEAVLTDTRNRYENLTKRDKLLETKLRGEFPDLKQPMVEHLLRHYRKRPRNLQFACTSITYLTEIGRCLVSGEKSELLPRDCLEFLRGMDSLDVMPNNLPSQIDANHWSVLCKLRRAKVELEAKITSCAVDLAEAEQTFVSYQKACLLAENRLSQIKEIMKERSMQRSEALEDMKVQIVLKMGQVETRLFGDPNELCNAVLVPFSVVERANNEIIAAGRKKLAVMRKTVKYRRTILWREWRHMCMRITLEDMIEERKVLQGVKVTKEIQHCLLTHQSREPGTEIEAKRYERILASAKERYGRILVDSEIQLIDSRRKVIVWSKRNTRLAAETEKLKLTSFKASMLARDETRQRENRYVRVKLKAIMKRTRMTKKVQDNYSELMALHTQLELLRLKTYPTLRLKGPTLRGTKLLKSDKRT